MDVTGRTGKLTVTLGAIIHELKPREAMKDLAPQHHQFFCSRQQPIGMTDCAGGAAAVQTAP